MKLSIVIPVYFNHDNLLPLYNDLREKVLCKLDCDYEILMVDDYNKCDIGLVRSDGTQKGQNHGKRNNERGRLRRK